MSLELVDRGSLTQPGIVGRLVRLGLGVLCIYGLSELLTVYPDFIERPIELIPNLSLMILVVLCVFNYVVNIGFSKNWNNYPLIVALSVLVLVAGSGYLIDGNPSSRFLGVLLMLWLGYFYAHLGLSFILAALIATPGCEMRSIPDLIGKISKSTVKAHHCPSSIISGIDRWESERLSSRQKNHSDS